MRKTESTRFGTVTGVSSLPPILTTTPSCPSLGLPTDRCLLLEPSIPSDFAISLVWVPLVLYFYCFEFLTLLFDQTAVFPVYFKAWDCNYQRLILSNFAVLENENARDDWKLSLYKILCDWINANELTWYLSRDKYHVNLVTSAWEWVLTDTEFKHRSLIPSKGGR